MKKAVIIYSHWNHRRAPIGAMQINWIIISQNMDFRKRFPSQKAYQIFHIPCNLNPFKTLTKPVKTLHRSTKHGDPQSMALIMGRGGTSIINPRPTLSSSAWSSASRSASPSARSKHVVTLSARFWVVLPQWAKTIVFAPCRYLRRFLTRKNQKRNGRTTQVSFTLFVFASWKRAVQESQWDDLPRSRCRRPQRN